MLDKAKADIRTEQENAMKAMESRVAEIALDAASKIMGEKNSSQQDLSLYDQFIKEAGDSNDETSINYAKALYELSVPEGCFGTEKIFRSTPQLKGALENPAGFFKRKRTCN